MTHPSDSFPPEDEAPNEPPLRHTGIGITQWLALGLLAFSLLAVVLALVINLILGSPGS